MPTAVPKFVSSCDVNVHADMGVVRLTAGIPRELPEAFWEAAIAAGATTDHPRYRAEPQGEDRVRIVREAVAEILAGGQVEHFRKGSVGGLPFPKVAAVSDVVGFKVSLQELASVLAYIQQEAEKDFKDWAGSHVEVDNSLLKNVG